jgi:hypothetical protein
VVAIVAGVNEHLTNIYETSMERTVTIGGPGGSPAVKLKLLHAVAAAAAGILFAPRLTAVATLAGLVKGVTVTVDTPLADAADAA